MNKHSESQGQHRKIRPFVQGRFEDLPELPTRSHPYFQTEVLELQLSESPFGQMKAHVRKFGQGPPLFLIHGLMTSSYSWRYVFESLGEHYTCYAPDLPGAGRSEQPMQTPYTPENLALWLREVMKALGLYGGPVLANSMGGYLAMQLALMDQEAMSCVINLHSPGVPEPRLYALKAILSLPGSRRLLRWLIHRDPLRWAHKNVHYYDESFKSLEEAREYGHPLSSDDGADVLYKYLFEALDVSEMKRFQKTLEARKKQGVDFPVPLLLMYAEKDPMVPPRFGDLFAQRIPSAQYVRLTEASHFAHVDAVERFLPPVFDFLRAQAK